MFKLQGKPSAPKSKHPTLEMYLFFLCLWVIFDLLDPDCESGSGTGPTAQHRQQQ
jgi:hypothetical protein